MKPIKFKEQNCTYAENQDEYNNLPACKATDTEGNEQTISCWQLSFRERIKILFTGKLWLVLMTFGKPLQPTYMTTDKKDIWE